ncbi:MAG: hypothetical protein H7Y86_20160 [Rhizobacter sp.]|nr:hypothetical protein [Ferruginibacter sp.]
MKRAPSLFAYIPALFLSIFNLLPTEQASAQTGETYVDAMHARYKKNWYRTLSFTQDTEIYRNDSLIRKQVWYEMARFPFELRIDVDSINGGNKTFYKKDSTYRVRDNKIRTINAEPNPFIFFLGGMYMLSPDTVKLNLQKNGYDLALGSTTRYAGRKTFIIGAGNDNDSTRNQFWIDAEHLYIVRILLKSGNAILDVRLSDHVKLPKGWSETNVKFYRDGKLLQTEKYRDLKPDVVLGNDVFEVERYR